MFSFQTVDLVPGGSNIRVTNKNKLQYLDQLAQYHLATCVKDEVENFLKGLNELIPDNLLSIFDENELEVGWTLCLVPQNSVCLGFTSAGLVAYILFTKNSDIAVAFFIFFPALTCSE